MLPIANAKQHLKPEPPLHHRVLDDGHPASDLPEEAQPFGRDGLLRRRLRPVTVSLDLRRRFQPAQLLDDCYRFYDASRL
jgi:hypothetical protein